MSTNEYFDFHLHSSASDGELSPRSLVELLRLSDVKHAALTDHDTLDGFEEAAKKAFEAGIRLDAGIEITVLHGGKELHLLGLGILYTPGTDTFLADARARRESRIEKTLALFRKTGFPVFREDLPPTSAPGRVHLAQALLRLGFVSSFAGAFRKWLGKDRRYYLKPEGATLEEAIRWVVGRGGKAVLAHPHLMTPSAEKAEPLVMEAAALGLSGLEIAHATFPMAKSAAWRRLADKYGLGVTGGSDFHTPRSLAKPGRGIGGKCLEMKNLSGFFLQNSSFF